MGVTPDQGVTWENLSLDTDGSRKFNHEMSIDAGVRTFFTVKSSDRIGSPPRTVSILRELLWGHGK